MKRASSACLAFTGSTKTRRPIFTEGKYPFAFHSLHARKLGRDDESGNTKFSAVFMPTSVGSCGVVSFNCGVMKKILSQL